MPDSPFRRSESFSLVLGVVARGNFALPAVSAPDRVLSSMDNQKSPNTRVENDTSKSGSTAIGSGLAAAKGRGSKSLGGRPGSDAAAPSGKVEQLDRQAQVAQWESTV